ncbi:MAG TPA: aldo/keto reductase, partial [Candidatus Dormibacteraeota bacterium]|nr:aldo/keto reductase [Candidatus Dormibacteraeota bacterium]
MNVLGRSGLPVSRFGLGLAALGRPGYINLGHADDLHRDYRVGAMREAAAAVLDAAHAGGIRYVDAARSYGRAEAFLAAWLARRGHPPGSITIGSKWGYAYTAEWRVDAERHEIKDHSRGVFARQLDESRALLGSHLQLYQIHSATLDSGVLDDADLLRALAVARDGGLAIGLSLSGPRQADTLRRALAVRIDGAPLFSTVQATWNLIERSAGEALRATHDAGLGVIVKEGLANGRLTARNRDPDQRQRLQRAAERAGASIDALALAAVLAQPFADVVLSG